MGHSGQLNLPGVGRHRIVAVNYWATEHREGGHVPTPNSALDGDRPETLCYLAMAGAPGISDSRMQQKRGEQKRGIASQHDPLRLGGLAVDRRQARVGARANIPGGGGSSRRAPEAEVGRLPGSAHRFGPGNSLVAGLATRGDGR